MSEDDLPIPPLRLFKYLARARLDVIENLRIRFTPLMATNDIFEVRQTFKKLVGPRFDQLLSEQAVNVDPESVAIEELRKLGFSDEQARALATETLTREYGPNFKTVFQNMIENVAKAVLPAALNRDNSIEQILTNVGGRLVALSLSEEQHDSVMWAHYAEQGHGLVLEFDTTHSFFSQSPKTGKTRRLQKVEYFDGQIEELMEAPLKALISKTTNWAYEKEWRLVLERDEADVVLSGSLNPIHLFDLPAGCISRILLGYNADAKFVQDVKNITAASLPRVETADF